MAVNTAAFLVVNPDPAKKQHALAPESAPTWLWGQGTPDGDREPFLGAQKGTFYAEVDGTDDTALVWVKVDEGGDNDDWVRLFVENQALIDNADVAASAGIVGSKLANNARVQLIMSKEFNIDNGAGATDDDLILHTDRAITVLSAQIVYTEATDTAGVASANIKLGTAAGGAQLVAATAYQVSKAVGDKTAMTLVTGAGAVTADGEIWARHTGIATTEAGKVKVLVTFVVND